MKPSIARTAKLGPLPARLQHGAVELARETVKDAHSAPAQPHRAVDTVETMLRRDTVTKEMATTADPFRQAFRIAGAVNCARAT